MPKNFKITLGTRLQEEEVLWRAAGDVGCGLWRTKHGTVSCFKLNEKHRLLRVFNGSILKHQHAENTAKND